MTQTPSAVLPSKGSPLGLNSAAREMATVAANAVMPPPFPKGPFVRGDGRTVLFIPGFLAGDWTMMRLASFLRRLGYRVVTAGVAMNAGPTPRLIGLMEKALERAIKDGPVALVGQSLGGVIARDLARRHPDQVCCVITLGSPIRFPVITPLQPFAEMVARFHDPEWLGKRDEIAKPLPMPVTAIYSEEDGIVDWKQCLQDEAPDARNLCITGSHTTMGSNPAAQAAIAEALGRADWNER